MKSVLISMMLFGYIHIGFAQQESFEKRLKLDAIAKDAIERWEMDSSSISCLSDGLWEHILPKSTQGANKIILNKNELNYFLELDDIKIQTQTEPFANPEHWENRFGKQIRTITLSKPLTFLAIQDEKLAQFSVDSLVGIKYRTFYPFGELDVPDHNLVPIVFEQKNEFDKNSPVLLVSSVFWSVST